MSAAADDNGGAPPKPVDACTYLEGQLLFEPNKVLLRRVFFLDPEKTKYISVVFYPARNYQPLVVKTLSDHLPVQIYSLWRGDFYNVMDGEFAMHSASPFNTVISTVGKKKNRKSVLIKLNDVRYLAYISPLVENQLVKYTEAMPDGLNFVLATLNSTSSVDPPANSTSCIINFTKN